MIIHINILNDKYATTNIFNKLKTENFPGRLKEVKLVAIAGIADFVKNTYLYEELININQKFTLNKTRHVENKRKLDDL